MEPVATLGLKSFNTCLPAGQLNVRFLFYFKSAIKQLKNQAKYYLKSIFSKFICLCKVGIVCCFFAYLYIFYVLKIVIKQLFFRF